MFRLDKWYLDLVTPDGDVVIGYDARLEWGVLRFRFASILESPVVGPARERSSVRGVDEPRVTDDGIAWSHAGLDLSGNWSGRHDIEARLLETPAGTIDWHGFAPNAAASLTIGGRQLSGIGYADRLTMTIPPWSLPFHRLLWGRYASSRHSAVWIEWTGASHQRWVWLDGRPAHDAVPSSLGVERFDGIGSLALRPGRDIRNHAVLAWLGVELPGVARRLIGRLDRMHEHKVVAPAVLSGLDQGVDRGWAVHEEVTW